MKWLRLTIDTTDSGLEIVAAALDAAGISSVEFVESRARAMDFLNRSALYWDFADERAIGADTPQVVAYLPDLPESLARLSAAANAVGRLASLSPGVDLGALSFRTSSCEDADWENNWKQYYRPIEIGEKLLILPDWETQPVTDRAVVRLDPGLAFGTGDHSTTRLCLEFLERVVRPGDRVLDIGSGSGILTIGACLLGAYAVTAVDIDPVAAKATLENAVRNGLDGRIRVLTGDILQDVALRANLGGCYDIVLVNIVADVILRIAPLAFALLKENARCIVSGIIDERREELAAALTRAGFAVAETCESGGWIAMLLEARSCIGSL